VLVTLVLSTDTIVALATPGGRSALALVRVSGARAHDISRSLLTHLPATRQATLCRVAHPLSKAPIDEAIVTRFDAPRSYTGEPMVEFSCHGGLVAPAAVVAALITAGAREARPGEFTQRALLRGKIDLLQAEAISDLIDAETSLMREAALNQVDGSLSRVISALRDQLLELEALLVYDIDFPEEDDGPVSRERIAEAATRCQATVEMLLDTAELGRIARTGATVVLAGAPNVGKSSLFNALLGERRALVTSIPGTTRDTLDAVIEAGGIPLRLVDTAGLRNGADVVEQLGIEAAMGELERAHLVLVCGETSDGIDLSMRWLEGKSKATTIRVLTKADINREDTPRANAVVSAEKRTGLAELTTLLGQEIASRYGTIAPNMPVLTRVRHLSALMLAREELIGFSSLWASNRVPTIVVAGHIRTALHTLDTLIGSVEVEDILEAVFSRFCVGK